MKIFKKSIVIFVLSMVLIFTSGCDLYDPNYLRSDEYDFDFCKLIDANDLQNEFIKFKVHYDEYLGSSIRTMGVYVRAENPNGGYYNFILCGEDGVSNYNFIEIIYEGDYPNPGSIILVTGVLDKYEEDGNLFDCIICDSLEKIEIEE